MIKARNLVSQVTLKINRFQIPQFPEKLKGGRIEKWADYWVNVSKDYKEACLGLLSDCKRKPLKALIYCTGVCSVIFAFNKNPDINEFKDVLQRYNNDSALLSSKVRNKQVDDHYNFLVDCFNHDLIRRISFGIGSLLWVDNYSNYCGLFKTQCSYLKPQYLTFHERIVDVGFLGSWWNIKRKFKVFDINGDEWNDQSKKLLFEGRPAT